MKFLLLISFSTLLISCSTQKKVTIIAHRGASAYLPEHTLPAQAMAHAFNVDYIEPDVVLTKDNVPIVLHDIHLDTTTNVMNMFPKRKRQDGHFYAIDFNLAEIKKLQVTERMDMKNRRSVFKNRFPLFFSKFEIPTLEETIELVKGLNKSRNKNIGLYPEIKAPSFHQNNQKDITKIVVEILKKHGLFNSKSKIILQCFEPTTLKRLRDEFKSPVKLVQLIGENQWAENNVDYDYLKTKEGIYSIAEYADGIGPWIPQIIQNKNIVKWAKDKNLLIHAYTLRLDRPYPGYEDINKLYSVLFNELKIDGVFTDFPDIKI